MNLKKPNSYIYPIIAAVVVRLAMIPFLNTSRDALMEYGTIARNMLSGFGYSFSWFHSNGSIVILPSAYMPPGQVFIDYIFLGIFGDSQAGIITLFIFQIAEACGFVYFSGKIAGLLFKSAKATMVTIWLAALYPTFIYATTSFGVTSSVLFLNAFVFYLALRFSESLREEKKSLKCALLFGAACGLLLLFRGEAPLFVFLSLAFICYRNKIQIRRSIFYSSIVVLCATSIIAPWVIRNCMVFHRFIPISTNGGFNFWRGNNPITNGSPLTETGGPLWTTDEIWNELEPFLDKRWDFEKVNSDAHIGVALGWISENPGKFALLSLKKGLILWTFDLRNKLGGTPGYIALYACTLAALLNGIYFIRKNKVSAEIQRTGLQLMIVWCILTTFVAMIILPLERFQVLLIGIYLPVIGYGIAEIFKRKSETILSKETGVTNVS